MTTDKTQAYAAVHLISVQAGLGANQWLLPIRMTKIHWHAFQAFACTLVGECLFSRPASAAELSDGAALGLAWGIPFIGLLTTIALGQALFPASWIRHYGKVVFLWIVAVVVPIVTKMGSLGVLALTRLMILDY
ncbi:MAG TPA: sodium:proton antiporter, partial [Dehalococcoidia bacterium]|nr:sodium:proton antiporter [Dehalococcoidia bacterium]